MSTQLTDDAGAIAITMGTSWPAPLFGLLFLLVGLWLVRDLRVYRHVRSRPLADFSHLEVDVLTVSSNSSRGSRSGYQVELAAHNRKNQLVGLFDAGEDAMVHARRLGALIGVPVEDRREVEAPAEER